MVTVKDRKDGDHFDGRRFRRVNINRKIRRLGKHLNREEVQLCLNSFLILRGNLKSV